MAYNEEDKPARMTLAEHVSNLDRSHHDLQDTVGRQQDLIEQLQKRIELLEAETGLDVPRVAVPR